MAAVLVGVVALFLAVRHNGNQPIQTVKTSTNQLEPPGASAARPDRMNRARRAPLDTNTPAPNVQATASKSLWIDALRSAPMYDVMRKHWPAAKEGDADSMVIVHAIMSNCLPYRRRFDERDIAEVHARFAENNDPELNALNESIWRNCADIYANWDKYDGWREMIAEAARNGQPYAMIETGWSRLTEPEHFHEGLALITVALLSGDPVAVSSMTDVYDSAGAEPGVSYGWLLAACDLGLDCSAGGALMANTCGPFSQTCGVSDSVRDFLVREHGDYGYWVAEREAKKIVNAIKRGRIGDLEIETDLRNLRKSE